LDTEGRFGAGKIALAVSALILATTVGVKTFRGHGSDSAPPLATAPAFANPASIEALERRANEKPLDIAAWQTLGAAYFASGRYENAVVAYEKAGNLGQQSAQLWSSLGEARVMASKTDPMPAIASAEFERALALDPKDSRARYFLAVKKDLAGDHNGAIRDWLGLLADTPPGAPWESDLRRTIEQVGKINRIEVASRIAATLPQPAPIPIAARAIPGPSAKDLQAAASIPPSEQRNMAEAMVARLEARLHSQPKDFEGWVMLIRSRASLSQPDKASAALRAAIAANPNNATQLTQEAASLGVR
jgi:cytochrome c-type biogenesis protein CcmH